MLNPALSSSYGFEKLEIPRPNVSNQEHNDRKKRFESERVLKRFLIFFLKLLLEDDCLIAGIFN